jgi:DNA-binding response OmpR family regulator
MKTGGMTKILIIDDDPDVRTVMNVLLKKKGYDVETASRKEEALSTIHQFKPAVILLDVLLSGSDGRELCREIKDHDQWKKINVIMFSAHPGAADNISSYGADDFITKPVNTEMLLEKIERLSNILPSGTLRD